MRSKPGATCGANLSVSGGIYAHKTLNGDHDVPTTVGNRLSAIWADARFSDNDPPRA